jgi:hypothetical protein
MPTDIERHSRVCRVCQDPRRQEIEFEFEQWKPIAVIAREKKLSQSVLYRHFHAAGLFGKRDRNLKSVLARFIDRGYRVKVTAQSLIAAIQAYSKINAEGQWIDKTENLNETRTQELFARMTQTEMLRYAQTGELPTWFQPGNPS